ncbi:hypothetical protein BKA82DRAFT_4009734 [Pisolithus tinctorius]|nr:hypothetical protein BKA82DRAFT_4009734 [Pisolithus tinctorius]
MSTDNSSRGQHPQRAKANLHPRQIVLNAQVKQHTSSKLTIEMEVTMEVELVTQDTAKVKSVKLKSKLRGRQGRPMNICGLPHVANIEAEAYHPREVPASGIKSAGNQTPHNSAPLGSQIQTNSTSNPPPTVPSLTTKATSVSSAISVAKDDLECTIPQDWTECHMVGNKTPAAVHDGDESTYQKPIKAAACTTIMGADVESDLEANTPISHRVQAGLKSVHMKIVKEPQVTTMTNIRIDQPVKKTQGWESWPPQVPHLVSHFQLGPTAQLLVTHFVNADLPDKLQEDRRWSKQMLPTLFLWAGCFPDLHLTYFLGRCPGMPRQGINVMKKYAVKGLLALCAAAVQVNNQISSHSMKVTVKTPLKLNKVSRKESSSLIALAFSEHNWGASTHDHFALISKCNDATLSEIVAGSSPHYALIRDVTGHGSSHGDQWMMSFILLSILIYAKTSVRSHVGSAEYHTDELTGWTWLNIP